MATNENKNAISNIMRDRYTRILGVEPENASAFTQTSLTKWPNWVKATLAVVVGVFILSYVIDKLTSSLWALDQKQISITLPLKKLPNAPAVQVTKPRTSVSNTVLNNNPQKPHDLQDKTASNPVKPNGHQEAQFLVIATSTKSQEDALALAHKLATSGYDSEVILSTSDYYGVVLGRYSFDEANKALAAAVASGIVKHESYLITPERVKALIYPVPTKKEAHSDLKK